jgi:hypothetical protein
MSDLTLSLYHQPVKSRLVIVRHPAAEKANVLRPHHAIVRVMAEHVTRPLIMERPQILSDAKAYLDAHWEKLLQCEPLLEETHTQRMKRKNARARDRKARIIRALRRGVTMQEMLAELAETRQQVHRIIAELRHRYPWRMSRFQLPARRVRQSHSLAPLVDPATLRAMLRLWAGKERVTPEELAQVRSKPLPKVTLEKYLDTLTTVFEMKIHATEYGRLQVVHWGVFDRYACR